MSLLSNHTPIPGIRYQYPVSGASNRRRSAPCYMVPTLPTGVVAAFTGTHSLMTTAPGDFDAVAVVAINIDASSMTIDQMSVAVSERSDTSKTIPTIGGTQYNQAAPAGTQNGFIGITWGGSASVTLAAGSQNVPTVAVSDFTPISSVPRVDNPAKFPLVLVRGYFNARTLSTIAFPTAADVDSFNTFYTPYEWYQVAQATVDGATPATAGNFTASWSLGASTQTMRILGLAYRIRGSSDTVFFSADSIGKGIAANGDTNPQKPGNIHNGWFGTTMRALASKSRPVGYVNFGISGNSSTLYQARAKAQITNLKPSIALYCPYTVNDTPSNAMVITQQMARTAELLDHARTAGVLPVLVTPTPQSPTLALELDLVAKINAITSAPVINNHPAIYDPTNSGNSYIRAGMNFDADHPNAAGHLEIATLRTIPALRTLLDS